MFEWTKRFMAGPARTGTRSRGHSIGRAVLVAGLVGVVSAAAFFGSPRPAAAASWIWHNVDRDAYWDVATLDANRNGCYEDIWFDVDNDSRLDVHLYNLAGSGDCFLEIVTFDMNEDGRPELWARDVNGVEGFDYAYLDQDRNGSFETTLYIGSSTTIYAPVSGAPTYDGLGGLLNTMAGMSGYAYWP